MELRACPPLAALTLAVLALPGCRGEPQPPPSAAAPTQPPFALAPVATPSPAEQFAPTVNALPPASRPLIVDLDEGPERYRLIDQALAASEAFGDTPPDYVVRYRGAAISIWRAANGGIRAVERLPGGERTYFYRALTEQPYLVAGPSAAFGYDRGTLAAAYDGDGLPLPSLDASRRVVAAARLLDRGSTLHGPITQARRQPAHADWRIVNTIIGNQRRRWRHSLGQQADWRAWHQDQTADREDRWSAERRQRLAYAATLRAVPAPLPPPLQHKEAEPVVALAAAPAKAAEPPPPSEHARPTAQPTAPVKTSRRVSSVAAKTGALRNNDHPRKHAGAAKAKRKTGKPRKRIRPQAHRLAVARRARIEQPARIEQTAKAQQRQRTPKILRDVGDFFDRTFGVRAHRGSASSGKD